MEPEQLSCSLTLNSLLECCIRNDKLNKAVEIFETQLNSDYSQKQVYVVDLITFSTIIKGYCKYYHIDKALNLFELMKTKLIQPDEILYNSLIDGCSKNGKIDISFKLYQEMLGNKQIIPSTITFNSLIDSCVRAN